MRALQVRVRVHVVAPLRVQLEVEVRGAAVRVARVAHVADRLAGDDLGAALQALRVRDAGDAPARVVVPRREVVVQVDVEVLRAAPAVQVEHAAGARGRRVERDGARLGGDGDRPARRHEVVALVAARAARVAVVVGVRDLADDREDDARPGRRGRGRGCRRARPGWGRLAPGLGWLVAGPRNSGAGDECRGEDGEEGSGCRPGADHQSGSRAKRATLASVSPAGSLNLRFASLASRGERPVPPVGPPPDSSRSSGTCARLPGRQAALRRGLPRGARYAARSVTGRPRCGLWRTFVAGSGQGASGGRAHCAAALEGGARVSRREGRGVRQAGARRGPRGGSIPTRSGSTGRARER